MKMALLVVLVLTMSLMLSDIMNIITLVGGLEILVEMKLGWFGMIPLGMVGFWSLLIVYSMVGRPRWVDHWCIKNIPIKQAAPTVLAINMK